MNVPEKDIKPPHNPWASLSALPEPIGNCIYVWILMVDHYLNWLYVCGHPLKKIISLKSKKNKYHFDKLEGSAFYV